MSNKNPTNQTSRYNAMSKDAGRRINYIYTQSAVAVSNIQTTKDIDGRFNYNLDPALISSSRSNVSDLINNKMFGNASGVWTKEWWANFYINGAFDDGIKSAILDAKKITPLSILPDQVRKLMAMDSESFKFDSVYAMKLKSHQAGCFESMKSLSTWMENDIMSSMKIGMESGKSPSEISKSLINRMDVAKRMSVRTSATEVNVTFNKSKLDQFHMLNLTVYAETDYEIACIHRSAMIPTTRMDHLRRHGVISNPAEQNYWWDNVASGGRINCHCTASAILRNKKTLAIVQKGMQESMTQERDEYEKEASS